MADTELGMSPREAAQGRSAAVQDLARQFDYLQLPEFLQVVSRPCAALASIQIQASPDGPQLEQGLWDLLRAKDCFVRAARPPETDGDKTYTEPDPPT